MIYSFFKQDFFLLLSILFLHFFTEK